jgi:hypothetical protein
MKIETFDVGAVDWNATAIQYMKLNKQKTEAIQRVRELHKSVQLDLEWGFHCEYCDQDYPCGTIKALDGEQNE